MPINKVAITQEFSFNYLRMGTTSKDMPLRELYRNLSGFYLSDNYVLNDEDKKALGAYLDYKKDSPSWNETKRKLAYYMRSKGYFCFKINE